MEIIINGVVYVPKETKSELELLKSKYGSGDYICVARWEHKSKLWYEQLVDNPFLNNHLDNATEIKLIHKKHKNILDAWLADNSVEIECKSDNETYWTDNNFIKDYRENLEYRLKQQYPIFKRNEDGEIYKLVDDINVECVLSSNLIGYKWFTHRLDFSNCETIPYDKEKGLYHLQPVFYKPNDIDCCIDFYDAKYCQLVRRGAILKYYNIEPITPEQLKTMPFVWEMYKKYKG